MKRKKMTKSNRLNEIRIAHKMILRALRRLEAVTEDDRVGLSYSAYLGLLDMLYEYERLLVDEIFNPDIPF